MNILIWNCRGALNPTFINVVNNLDMLHSPAMMIISKTKVGGLRVKGITEQLPFDGAICTNTIGLSGGLWLLWDSNRIEVTELTSTEQEIHVLISNNPSSQSWLFFAIYASPRYAERQLLWDNLSSIATRCHRPLRVISMKSL